ncbi:MAG: sugar transferase [Armatimonadetes bacterium]|nr:sugar transferase [Armatimonadota bacterium]
MQRTENTISTYGAPPYFSTAPASEHLRASSAKDVRYRIAKRTLDIVVAATMLVLLFPLFVLIALLVSLPKGEPAFYWQLRVGQNGRRFRFYKFRSMVVGADAIKASLMAKNEADGPIFKIKHDPRVTPVGRILRRYSLDELPQLIHVLRGEMSLVGPRPHLPQEIADCSHYPAERLTVPPGLLCLREVGTRSLMSFDQWLDSDLEYIRTRSLRTDFSILCRAFRAVAQAEGAY